MELEVICLIHELLDPSPPPSGGAPPPAVSLVDGHCQLGDSLEAVATRRYLRSSGMKAAIVLRKESLLHSTRAQLAEVLSDSKILFLPREELIKRLPGFEADLLQGLQTRQNNLHEILRSAVACEKNFEFEKLHAECTIARMRATYYRCSIYIATANPGFGGSMVECLETVIA